MQRDSRRGWLLNDQEHQGGQAARKDAKEKVGCLNVQEHQVRVLHWQLQRM